ncbi:hypothetical protein BPORC_0238 [Bifidobacterium porcinum]|nr:hypothetical protein BPORC_0238 [Bifidobacterium porcinum]
MLIVGTVGISTAIRQLVSSHAAENRQPAHLAALADPEQHHHAARGRITQSGGMGNNYFLQVRYVENGEFTGKVSTPLVPAVAGLTGTSIVSMPKLPTNDQLTDDMYGKPFTKNAVLRAVANNSVDGGTGTDPNNDLETG